MKQSGEVVSYGDVEEFPESCIGFIYKITNKKTGKFYIGRKSLYSNVRKKLTKKELAEYTKPGKKPVKKLVTTESNWLDYWGSSKVLLEEIKQNGTEDFQREILKFCYNKKQLTYWEIHYQCVENVLLSENSYNDNISSKFFRKDLVIPQ